jgi:putative selenium metabolism protein SsnA
MVGMIGSIRNGVTTIFDHHSSPSAVPGSLTRIADVAQLTGLRSCLCYEVSDRNGDVVVAQGIEENRESLQRYKDSPDGRLRALFGLHASFTLSDNTLDRCRKVAADFDAGFHVLTAEAQSDVDQCIHQHGMRVVERWHKHGILGPRTLAAHCVHVNDCEIDLLRESQTRVVHNPQSNMNNAVGYAPVPEMMRRGIRVGLGTNAYTAGMFESMQSASLLIKHQSGNTGAGWAEPPAMLFSQNAAIASECFGRPLGKLVPGACADIIVVDYDPPTPLCAENLHNHLLSGFFGCAVSTTIIGGRVLMHDRKLLAIDENEVMAKARAAATALWKRF